MRNNTYDQLEEIRWEIVKVMLKDFPQLRQRVEEYLKVEDSGGF